MARKVKSKPESVRAVAQASMGRIALSATKSDAEDFCDALLSAVVSTRDVRFDMITSGCAIADLCSTRPKGVVRAAMGRHLIALGMLLVGDTDASGRRPGAA